MNRLTAMTWLMALGLGACGGGGSGTGGDADTDLNRSDSYSSGSSPDPTAAVISGLTARPVSASCRADNFSLDQQAIALQPVATGVSFSQPLKMLQAPGNDDDWYMLEQGGLIKRFQLDGSSTEVFFDASALIAQHHQEQGLLSMAFHPAYPQTPELFISYTAASDNASVIARYRVDTASQTVVAESGETVLREPQPQWHHNGGNIEFGPDGYLYIGLGDGGPEPGGSNQSQPSVNRLGSMLRIDINARPYAIPSDNPFADSQCSDGICPEIWARGLRNPWRWSFDRVDGQLWLGDVGESGYEEINLIERGNNYGWSCYEGEQALFPALCDERSSLTFPVAGYDHSQGVSVTGGYVYRGSALQSLYGHYLYADFAYGVIWGLAADLSGEPEVLLSNTSRLIASFAEGRDGELYVLDLMGSVHKIVAATTTPGRNPATLSGTGCMQADNPAEPVSGVLPYTLNSPLWTDGAGKQRWLVLPDDSRITADASGDWAFPVGSILIKQFLVDEQPVETRFLIHKSQDQWQGLSYAWREDGSDAELLTDAETRTVHGRDWAYPANQCFHCHSRAAKVALGPENRQLQREHRYDNGISANQLTTLQTLGMLDPGSALAAISPYPEPAQPQSGSLSERARSYLHGNCSGCHQPGGTGQGGLDLRYDTALAATGLCNRQASYGASALTSGTLLEPGNAPASALYQRLASQDPQEIMPPLGVLQNDSDGLALISEWINALPGCE